MTEYIDPSTIQPVTLDDLDDFNEPPNVEANTDSTLDQHPLDFPSTRQRVGEALGKDSAGVTIGRWIKKLAEYGLLCVNDSNRVTESGYKFLLSVKLKLDQGQQLGDAITAVANEQPTTAPQEIESVVGEFVETSEALGSKYTALAVRRRSQIQTRSQAAEKLATDAMEALRMLVNVQQTESELAADDKQAKQTQWRAEVLKDLAQEKQFKLNYRAQVCEELGV